MPNQQQEPQRQSQHYENEQVDGENDMSSYIPSYLNGCIVPYYGDFCISPHFHPQMIVQLMAEGFLPMAGRTAYDLFPNHYIDEEDDNKDEEKEEEEERHHGSSGGHQSREATQVPWSFVLLPKLHEERCVVPLLPQSSLHVARSVQKKSKHFSLTMNTCWDRVIEYCREQHGSSTCWLYPPLVKAYRTIYEQPMQATVILTSTTNTFDSAIKSPTTTGRKKRQPATPYAMAIPVRMVSVEVWDNRTKELVAGELGYTVGHFMYTSLTGFSRQDSAGSVQLAAWGRYLQQKQFRIWDLGMDMPYKQQLGGQLWPRRQFVDYVQMHRRSDNDALQQQQPRMNGMNESTHNGVHQNHLPNSPLSDSIPQPLSCQQLIQQKVEALAGTIPPTKPTAITTTTPTTLSVVAMDHHASPNTCKKRARSHSSNRGKSPIVPGNDDQNKS